MKVCLASYPAVGMLHGGPNTQARMTAQHLSEFGVSPVFLDPWKEGDWKDYDCFHLFAANIGTYHLAREIHSRGVPLVISPIMFSSHTPGFVRLGLRFTRLLQNIGRGIWSDYAIAADICSWGQAVLPNTRAEADLVVRGLGIEERKITVIPNGVEERFSNADPTLFSRKYGVEGFVLYVGHIGYERKNVLSLIRALGAIDHPAVLIGPVIRNAYGEECLREAAKHKQILVIDGIPHGSELLASAYAACSVFALPSLFETPGIAALEAGLAGAKIVITPHGGTKEYFEDLAHYVDYRSVDSIHAGILRGLKAPANSTLRGHILKNFTWRSIAEKTSAVYRSILADS